MTTIQVDRGYVDCEGGSSYCTPFTTMDKAWEYVRSVLNGGDKDIPNITTQSVVMHVHAPAGTTVWRHVRRNGEWLYGYKHYEPDHPRCQVFGNAPDPGRRRVSTQKRKQVVTLGFGA